MLRGAIPECTSLGALFCLFVEAEHDLDAI